MSTNSTSVYEIRYHARRKESIAGPVGDWKYSSSTVLSKIDAVDAIETFKNKMKTYDIRIREVSMAVDIDIMPND